MPTQLEFGIRASTSVKSVHLRGSWDNYSTMLPLKNSVERPDAWRGLFNFSSASIVPGKRYWYHYVVDGQHTLHDPSKKSVVEPSTGCTMNILDIPAASAVPARYQTGPALGRPISPGQIISPRPCKPQASGWMEQFDVSSAGMYASGRAYSTHSVTTIASSEVPSLTSSPASMSAATSISSSSEFFCECELYGVTASGHKVRLSCGGRVCGSDSGSSCCDSDDDVATPISGVAPSNAYHKMTGARVAVHDLSSTSVHTPASMHMNMPSSFRPAKTPQYAAPPMSGYQYQFQPGY